MIANGANWNDITDSISISVLTPKDDLVTVKIKITYGEEEVYSTSIVAENMVGTTEIKLKEFCIGKGQYTIIAKLENETTSTSISVEKWIDSFKIICFPPILKQDDETVRIDLTTQSIGIPVIINGTGIITIKHNETGLELPEPWEFSISEYYTATIKIPKSGLVGPGNYTIYSLNFTNEWAKGNVVTTIAPASSIRFQIQQ